MNLQKKELRGRVSIPTQKNSGSNLLNARCAAGTVPMMLAIGLSGKLVPFSLRLKLLKASPVSIFLLGALFILRGMSLCIPYLSPDLSAGHACCH